MNISFGAKIPLSRHKVYCKSMQKPVDAILYEIDGKDEGDSDYIASQRGNWGELRRLITVDMFRKHDELSSNQELPQLDKYILQNNKFYSLENNKGDSIGLLEMTGIFNSRDVHYFYANPDKDYKYVGQIMLAEAAKDIANEKDAELTVNDPSDEGREFYINRCGFRPRKQNLHMLYMKQADIVEFIENVKKRTEYLNILG